MTFGQSRLTISPPFVAAAASHLPPRNLTVNDGQHVLVVDELTETEEVLQAILAPRGLTVQRIRRAVPAAINRLDDRPDVVVIDADTLSAQRASATEWQGVPQVIIGSAIMPSNPGPSAAQRHLSKPFQFPELIQAVEQLLSAARRD